MGVRRLRRSLSTRAPTPLASSSSSRSTSRDTYATSALRLRSNAAPVLASTRGVPQARLRGATSSRCERPAPRTSTPASRLGGAYAPRRTRTPRAERLDARRRRGVGGDHELGDDAHRGDLGAFTSTSAGSAVGGPLEPEPADELHCGVDAPEAVAARRAAVAPQSLARRRTERRRRSSEDFLSRPARDRSSNPAAPARRSSPAAPVSDARPPEPRRPDGRNFSYPRGRATRCTSRANRSRPSRRARADFAERGGARMSTRRFARYTVVPRANASASRAPPGRTKPAMCTAISK